MKARRSILHLLIGLTVPIVGPLVAQPAAPDDLALSPTITSLEGLSGSIDEYVEARTRELAGAREAAAEDFRSAILGTVPSAISAKTTSLAPQDDFAGRVGGAIADFLPVFQFAVESVSTSEDRRAVTVKANPLDGSWGALSPQITIAEPKVLDALAQAIAEPVRTTQSAALLGEAGDFSDATVSVHYGFHRDGPSWKSVRRPLFGRTFSLYEHLVDELAIEAWASIPKNAETRLAAARNTIQDIYNACRLMGPGGRFSDSKDITFELMRQIARRDDDGSGRTETDPPLGCHRGFIPALNEAAAAMADLVLSIRELDLDALPALIDNQPQLVFAGSYRFTDEVVGPESWNLDVQYEIGTDNLNTVLREYRAMQARDNGVADALAAYRKVVQSRNVEDETKFVIGVTFTRRDDYDFNHSYRIAGADGEVDFQAPPLSASVSLPSGDEWRAKVLYTRFVPEISPEPAAFPPDLAAALSAQSLTTAAAAATAAGTAVAEERPRFTAGIELVETDDPTRQNQIVGRLSYVLPLKGGLTLPVSVTWANKSGFLGEQDEVFGAHVGFSYGFDGRP